MRNLRLSCYEICYEVYDDPDYLRSASIQKAETALLESMATKHGMVLQNLALMAEALRLADSPISPATRTAGNLLTS